MLGNFWTIRLSTWQSWNKKQGKRKTTWILYRQDGRGESPWPASEANPCWHPLAPKAATRKCLLTNYWIVWLHSPTHSPPPSLITTHTTAYRCTLVRKMPRWGAMRVSQKRIAFTSKKLNTRVVLPWKKITSICISSTENMPDVADPSVPALLIKAANNSEVRECVLLSPVVS